MRVTLLLVTGALAISAPAATAATLKPGIVYDARSGEVNRLRIDPVVAPFGTVSVTEYVAPLKLGAGCVLGTPIVCSDSIGAIVHLGDMNDVAWVEPRGISTVSVFGGAGDDDLFADGQSATVEGGAGDDVIRVGANGLVRADGGPGNDQIAGRGGEPLFDGGAGDDLIVGNGEISSNVSGQAGNDALVAREDRGGGTMTGNAGADVITFLDPASETEGWTFDAGAGDDIISGPAPTVDGGAGNDLIDVAGGTVASNVTCGKGFDVVWADGDDLLSSDCERRIKASSPSLLPGVAEARARAEALLNHLPQPDPAAS